MIQRADPSSVAVTVYHLCPAGASGSALGPHELVSYWWAETDRIRIVSGLLNPAERGVVEAAIVAELGGWEASLVRSAQDAAAESVV